MQLKVTTTVAGETFESTVSSPTPKTDNEQQAAFQSNAAILHATSAAVNTHQGSKIERLVVEVVA